MNTSRRHATSERAANGGGVVPPHFYSEPEFNPIIEVIDVDPLANKKRPHEKALEFWTQQRQTCLLKARMRGVREAEDHLRAARNAIFAIEQGRQNA